MIIVQKKFIRFMRENGRTYEDHLNLLNNYVRMNFFFSYIILAQIYKRCYRPRRRYIYIYIYIYIYEV